MIVAISRFRVAGAAEADDVARRFRERGRRVDAHAGFLGLEVLHARDEFLLVTRWADRDAMKAYLRSADFRLAHPDGQEKGAEFTVYEVVAD